MHRRCTFRFVKGQQKNITQSLMLFFIQFVLRPVKRATGFLIPAAPFIYSLHYVHVLFDLLVIFKSLMTEIFCPYIKGADFIRENGIFTAYFAPYLCAVIICLEPFSLLQLLFHEYSFFYVQVRSGVSLKVVEYQINDLMQHASWTCS